MAACRTDCVEKPLSAGFKALGRLIGKHPWWFFLIPPILSGVLGSGFYFLHDRQANDIEDQFTPVDGPAKGERLFIRDNFPQNDSAAFSSQRLLGEGTYASFIAACRLCDDVLGGAAVGEVQSLVDLVKGMKVLAGTEEFSYSAICTRTELKCSSDLLLDTLLGSEKNLTFPMHGQQFLGSSLGGVQMAGNSSIIKSAKAIRLHFYVIDDVEMRAQLWLETFTKLFSSKNHTKVIKVSHFTSLSRQQEFEANAKTVIPLFSITYFLAISFSVMSCSRLDHVRNKVWVATFGVLSAGLAVLCSFGLLLLIGVPFVITVASSPFLILGIGVDDMFIMISSWQQTVVHNQVEERMADTYKEAAVSITITTLTDVLAFYIGTMTAFGSVQSFCLYTGTAVLFCYFYNITFFGAFLALNGRREKSNRHWLTCMKIPKESQPDRSFAYRMCCVGGAYDVTTNTEKAPTMNSFIKMYYGPFLTNSVTKMFVILAYGLYLAASIYGCVQIKEGIDLRNLASDDSYVVEYYDDQDLYFSEYGPNIMVAITDSGFQYWDERERNQLNLCLQDFKTLPFVEKTMFTSWLDAYMSYGKAVRIDVDNKTMFQSKLPAFFNHAPLFQQDVSFKDNEIRSSRFFIQTKNISSAVDEKNLLNELRGTANRCPVPLLVYHPAFIYYDQYAVIVSNTIQNIVVATAVMLLISLLLIPNPLCSLWVTFAIGSVIVGVTGFMALWDVNLDSISMINLVICIGFSVDFSAHISYAFVSNSKSNTRDRAVDALYSLGYPILQGAISTILGVVVLSASKSYIFRTFFKIMFLVILFGALHGLVFIPVYLTFFAKCCR